MTTRSSSEYPQHHIHQRIQQTQSAVTDNRKALPTSVSAPDNNYHQQGESDDDKEEILDDRRYIHEQQQEQMAKLQQQHLQMQVTTNNNHQQPPPVTMRDNSSSIELSEQIITSLQVNSKKVPLAGDNNNTSSALKQQQQTGVVVGVSEPECGGQRGKLSPRVLDPSGALYYHWSMVVSFAFLYNFWSLSYRFAFREIDFDTVAFWFALDYSADVIYILDVVINFHTGYLEDGVLQRNIDKIGQHYRECTLFYLDCFCLLPLDVLYLSIGFNSILRCTRLVKIYKFWSYVDRTERHTNYPNVFRTFTLVHYILVIFHWNACLFHMISKNKIIDIENLYKINDNRCDDILCQYLHAFYWSTLALTTIGDLPRPRTKGEYVYITVELFFGLFLFASVLGHVANIVTNVSAARKEFQAKLDAVKTFMRMRRVSDELQNKVIRWFDYLWISQKSSDEERSVACLPDRLKAEIAIHVHLDTLKRVDIFQNTEAGFLCELVLRLKPVLFSPGDYVCRKNEVGHEMYIVSRGILEVVTNEGKTVVATLKAGSYFGEISVLNVGLAGNKRTASVRSVGYSDLFCLNKQDLWDVLKNYPNAEARIRARAEERLSKLDTNHSSSTNNSHSRGGGVVGVADCEPIGGGGGGGETMPSVVEMGYRGRVCSSSGSRYKYQAAVRRHLNQVVLPARCIKSSQHRYYPLNEENMQPSCCLPLSSAAAALTTADSSRRNPLLLASAGGSEHEQCSHKSRARTSLNNCRRMGGSFISNNVVDSAQNHHPSLVSYSRSFDQTTTTTTPSNNNNNSKIIRRDQQHPHLHHHHHHHHQQVDGALSSSRRNSSRESSIDGNSGGASQNRPAEEQTAATPATATGCNEIDEEEEEGNRRRQQQNQKRMWLLSGQQQQQPTAPEPTLGPDSCRFGSTTLHDVNVGDGGGGGVIHRVASQDNIDGQSTVTTTSRHLQPTYYFVSNNNNNNNNNLHHSISHIPPRISSGSNNSSCISSTTNNNNAAYSRFNHSSSKQQRSPLAGYRQHSATEDGDSCNHVSMQMMIPGGRPRRNRRRRQQQHHCDQAYHQYCSYCDDGQSDTEQPSMEPLTNRSGGLYPPQATGYWIQAGSGGQVITSTGQQHTAPPPMLQVPLLATTTLDGHYQMLQPVLTTTTGVGGVHTASQSVSMTHLNVQPSLSTPLSQLQTHNQTLSPHQMGAQQYLFVGSDIQLNKSPQLIKKWQQDLHHHQQLASVSTSIDSEPCTTGQGDRSMPLQGVKSVSQSRLSEGSCPASKPPDRDNPVELDGRLELDKENQVATNQSSPLEQVATDVATAGADEDQRSPQSGSRDEREGGHPYT